MSIKVVGINLAKNFFQVCVLNIDGTISSNRKVPRDKRMTQTMQEPFVKLIRDLIFILCLLNLSNNRI